MTDTRGRRMRGTPTAAALAEVLDLDGRIPWDTTEFIFGRGGPVRPVGIILRSDQTIREIIAALPPARRERKLEEAAVYGIDLDSHDEIQWPVTRPRSESGWFKSMSFDEWIAYESAKLPAGYTPVRLDPDETLSRELDSSRRDDAIRRELANGGSVASLVERTGLTRARIYQIRDRKR